MANVKSAFYKIIEHLKEKEEHTSKILIGPACENWLRSESNFALNFNDSEFGALNCNEFCYEEDKKRDITIYSDSDDPIVTHAIEIKAVYPAGNGTISSKWLNKLHEQLSRPLHSDETKKTSHIGLIFAIWTSSYNCTPREYFSRLSSLIESKFSSTIYTTQDKYKFRPIIHETSIDWREADMKVAMSALYIKKR